MDRTRALAQAVVRGGCQPHIARRKGGVGGGGHEGGGEVNLVRQEKGGVDLVSHKNWIITDSLRCEFLCFRYLPRCALNRAS